MPSTLPDTVYAIFTGVVNGLSNLVVSVSATTLRMVGQSANVFWRFDLESGEFVPTPAEGSGWAVQVVEMSGRDLRTSTIRTVPEVTMQMVDYKLSPAV